MQNLESGGFLITVDEWMDEREDPATSIFKQRRGRNKNPTV